MLARVTLEHEQLVWLRVKLAMGTLVVAFMQLQLYATDEFLPIIMVTAEQLQGFTVVLLEHVNGTTGVGTTLERQQSQDK